MIVHLIRTEDVDVELFAGVISLLQAIPGRMQFIGDRDFPRKEYIMLDCIRNESSLNYNIEWTRKRKIPPSVSSKDFIPPGHAVHWDNLFSKSADYRRARYLHEDELVILLTAQTNHRNWFSALDRNMPGNGFIHTADWELYLDASPVFPVAYEVISLVLQRHIYSDYENMKYLVHQRPRGCVNDFCQEKREIILKMRTADICQGCMEVMQKHLPLPVIDHALALMESMRQKMLYAQNFRQNSPPSRMLIDSANRIFLPDFGNIEINLRPLERALYFLFLRHPEGILMSGLCDHRQELFNIYAELSDNGDRREMKQRIEEMTNVLSNSASEKMSRIKRTFEQSIGRTLAGHYYIQGEPGRERRISFDRSQVAYERIPEKVPIK